MSTIADRVRTAQDKDGMLRRALERIIQLYTDKSHFVYELLQNAEEAEAKRLAAQQKEQEIRNNIKVGYTFEDNQDNGNFKYTITKITPKRVYLDLVHSYKSTHGIWKDGKFTGSQVVLVRCPKSGYIETECLVNELMHLGETYYNVADGLKGVCSGSREMEDLEFLPATETATEIL